MAEKFSYYPMDVDRFDESESVRSMSLAEIGLYILCLNRSWKVGSLPDDVEQVAIDIRRKAAEVKKSWPAVRACYVEAEGRPGRIVNPTQEEKRSGVSSTVKRAQSGGAARWGEKPNHAATRSQRLAEARKKGTHTKAEWQALLDACGNRCVKCGETNNIVKDHVTPIYQGGSDAVDNLQPLCGWCNSAKGPDLTDYAAAFRTPAEMPARTPALTPSEMPAECLPRVLFSLVSPSVSEVLAAACERVKSEYPREIDDEDMRNFVSFIETPEQAELFFSNLSLHRECWNPGFVPKLENFLRKGTWKVAPKSTGKPKSGVNGTLQWLAERDRETA